MDVAHAPGWRIRIRRSRSATRSLALLRSPGRGEDHFDGRESGQAADAAQRELVMDSLRASARERRSARGMGLELIPKSEGFANQTGARPVADIPRRAASILKPCDAVCPIATEPFGQPSAASLDGLQSPFVASGFVPETDGMQADLIFSELLHRQGLLPRGLGRSLGEFQQSSQCDFGYPLGIYPSSFVNIKRTMLHAIVMND